MVLQLIRGSGLEKHFFCLFVCFFVVVHFFSGDELSVQCQLQNCQEQHYHDVAQHQNAVNYTMKHET